jgi:dolichyl-phosphate-mannose-protein mannosyltransferase
MKTSNLERYRIWLWGGLGLILIFSWYIRFWEIGRFNEFVFDEVYYAKFANNYLIGKKFYNAHPPLSQYLIAIGIWLGDRWDIGRDRVNMLTGSLHSTFSYRWLNAVFGWAILPVIAAIGYYLTKRWSYTCLATLFLALDGLFLVDSRYALNNVFLIFFGMLGQLLVLMAIESSLFPHRRILLISAGISFGCSIGCKWNGLWFLLGIWILLAISRIWRCYSYYYLDYQADDLVIYSSHAPLLDRLARISRSEFIIALMGIPAIVYSLLWIPHLIQNPTPNFIDVQLSILSYHERIENGRSVHPYCADWYTWPLMMRPLAYYFQHDRVNNLFYDVHAMGNPLLWWLSCGGIIILSYTLLKLCYHTFTARIADYSHAIGLILYFTINYFVNLLPWIKVTRCLYIYHYMGALLFATMGLAAIVDLLLHSKGRSWRGLGIAIIVGIMASFIFWLPIYLGLPITQSGLNLRMWNFFIFNWS